MIFTKHKNHQGYWPAWRPGAWDLQKNKARAACTYRNAPRSWSTEHCPPRPITAGGLLWTYLWIWKQLCMPKATSSTSIAWESCLTGKMSSGHCTRASDSCMISGREDTDSTHDGQDTARVNKLKEVWLTISLHAWGAIRHQHTQTWLETQHFDERALLSCCIFWRLRLHNHHKTTHEI